MLQNPFRPGIASDGTAEGRTMDLDEILMGPPGFEPGTDGL